MNGISKTRMIAVVMVALFGATGAYSGWEAKESAGRVVMAEFTDVSPIIAGQQVKVHGVTVGEVGEPSYDAKRKVALVPLHVNASALPVHRDATAQVEPISLLGERFVSLDAGSANAPELGIQESIKTTSTGRNEDLQSVLDTLDDPTAAGLGALVTTLGQGANGNGENIQKAITAIVPSLTDTDKLVRVLRDQNKLLGSVIDRAAPVTSSIAAAGGSRLDHLVNSTHGLLGTTAVRDDQLKAMLRELPGTLSAARQTLGDLAGTADSAGKALGNMRPTTDNLEEIAHELDVFADSAQPALAAADPVLDRASDLLASARPVADQLRQAGPGLRKTFNGAEPIVTDLTNNLGNVLGFVRGWALSTNGRDGLSHYFRGHAIGTPDTVTGFVPGGGPSLGSPPRKDDPSPNKHVDDPTYKEPSQKTEPGTAGNMLNPGGLLNRDPKPGGSATGLTPEQERGAAGFLLGGGN